jgi:hypothetical protein
LIRGAIRSFGARSAKIAPIIAEQSHADTVIRSMVKLSGKQMLGCLTTELLQIELLKVGLPLSVSARLEFAQSAARRA